MRGWGNLADVRVNTQCGVRNETYVPLPLMKECFVGYASDVCGKVCWRLYEEGQ